MNSILVIFDCSGSMSEPFKEDVSDPYEVDEFTTRSTKIAAACEALPRWLGKSGWDKATIIPFHERAWVSETFQRGEFKTSLPKFLETLSADGSATRLAEALKLATNIARDSEEYSRFLIVTDGISHTKEEDLSIVAKLPENHGIDGILLDPSDDVRQHLREICIRGNFIEVARIQEFKGKLADRAEVYSSRKQIQKQFLSMIRQTGVLSESTIAPVQEIDDVLHDEIRRENTFALSIRNMVCRASEIMYAFTRSTRSQLEEIEGMIANLNIPNEFLIEKMEPISKQLMMVDKAGTLLRSLLDRFSKSSAILKTFPFEIVATHPKKLAKRWRSFILVSIGTNIAAKELHELEGVLSDLSEISANGVKQKHEHANITEGMLIRIELLGPDLEVSDPVKLRAIETIQSVHFLVKPRDECRVGSSHLIVRVSEAEKGALIKDVHLSVIVTDYLIDHISRPVALRSLACFAWLGSAATYILTFMALIDKALGFSAGTAAAGLGVFLLHLVHNVYTRPST